MIPRGRLWAGLCLLALPAMVAGFVPGLRAAVLALDAAFLVAAAVDVLLVRATRVTVARRLPPKLAVGVESPVRLQLHNPGRRAVEVTLQDDVPEGFAGPPEPLRFELKAAARMELPYGVTPTRRGSFGFGDLHLRVSGPLGLVAREWTVPAATEVRVYPDVRGARRLLLSSAAQDLASLGVRAVRRDGQGSEFSRLRDYAQGDSVRDVDWKATARRQRPVARTFESEKSQSVVLCLDAGRSMAAELGGVSKLDHAIHAALFLAFVALRNGDRVGLVVFSDSVKAYLPPAGGKGQYRRILEALYATEPQLTFVDYVELFRAVTRRLHRRSLLCLFTDYLDEEQASTLVAPLRRMGRRHVPLCLSLRDIVLEQLLETPPPTPEVAFQQAVATEWLADRERLKGRLGKEGVGVVDVHPEELSLVAVNRYLDIKSRGLL